MARGGVSGQRCYVHVGGGGGGVGDRSRQHGDMRLVSGNPPLQQPTKMTTSRCMFHKQGKSCGAQAEAEAEAEEGCCWAQHVGGTRCRQRTQSSRDRASRSRRPHALRGSLRTPQRRGGRRASRPRQDRRTHWPKGPGTSRSVLGSSSSRSGASEAHSCEREMGEAGKRGMDWRRRRRGRAGGDGGGGGIGIGAQYAVLSLLITAQGLTSH